MPFPPTGTVTFLFTDIEGSTYVLEYTGNLARAQDTPHRAARLYAATEALRGEIGVPVASANRAAHSGNVAAVRACLGDQAFEAVWAEGWAMPWEQAVKYALFEGQRRSTPAH